MAASIKVSIWFILISLASLVACTAGDAQAPAFPSEVAEDRPPTASTAAATYQVSTVEPEQAQRVSTEAPILATALASTPQPAPDSKQADANVLYVVARQESADSWHFTVTVEHPDLGWEDYADGWDVVLPDGTVSKPDSDSTFTRLLLHPHETEQPFTRSQAGVLIPPSVRQVAVRAHDIIDGFGGSEVIVDLDLPQGPGFEVQPLSQ